MVQIPLTNRPDLAAVVDDIDADLAGLAWYLKRSKSGFYVARSVRDGYKRNGKPRIKTVRLHRVIFARKSGQTVRRSLDVHHVDTNTLHNWRGNLESVGHVAHGLFSRTAGAYEDWQAAKYGPCLSC